ncbi:MAG: sigma-54-dependent Fis family transcriptional regulator [Ramlibacter sp.]|nr:sigma-54-dependent Fis family transcriptional regulator [Ramlibacter sp.]
MFTPNHATEVMAALEGRRAALRGELDTGLQASWLRSVEEHHLEPDRIPEPDVLTHGELLDRRVLVEDLSVLSSPEVERLYQRLASHAQVVMLTDAEGIAVLYRSSAAVLDRCTTLRVLPGSIWTERSQGTNGIGMCLREQRPLSVVKEEHFATKLAGLSCTVAPIFGPEGKLAGILNVSSLHGTDHAMQAVLREMVAASARRIENRCFDRRHAGTRVLRLSRYDDFCDGAAEARVAIDDSGRIVDATPVAQRILARIGGTANAGMIGRKFGTVVGIDNIDRLLGAPEPTIDSSKGRVHVRVVDPPRRSASGSRKMMRPNDREGDATGASTTSPTLLRIAGSDPSIAERLRLAQRLHACGLPLLLQGESGSGKTQLARALHDSGPHSKGSFVAINCAAIPQELIESELFGYRAGAFTGAAKQGSPGRLIAADGGTLFLDEIGDMPLPLQGRLLQVLSEGEFVPVGATEPVRVRFALISATLRNLEALVKDGRFRDDLYYRLSGSTLALPPLRLRADRIELIEHAFARAAANEGATEWALSDDARRTLGRYGWPGNLRELQHVARFAVAVSDSPVIDSRCLPESLLATISAQDPIHGALGAHKADGDPAAVAEALRRTGWNVSAAAAHLGVSRATLHRRLHEFHLSRPKGE